MKAATRRASVCLAALALNAACGPHDHGGEGSSQDAGTDAASGRLPDGATGPEEEGGLASDGASLGPGDGGGAGGDASDAVGSDAGPCPPSQLHCSGFCVPNDAVNCGTCGHDCTDDHASSTPQCDDGVCTFPSLTCTPGWAHCVADASAGCETELSRPANCGSCGNACTSPPVCSGTPGAYSCTGLTMLAAAVDTTFALFADGTVEAVGSNSGDEETGGALLGDGDGIDTQSTTPVQVTGVTTATAIAAGDGDACALLADGTVVCWGDNSTGELGVDANPNDPNGVGGTLVPVAVSGLTGVIAIAAGGVHTCALIQGGTVECWGSNDEGELGTSLSTSCNGGNDICTSTPTPVPGLTGVTAIAIGSEEGVADHTCALLSSGSIRCWGYDYDGELGDGTRITTSPPGTATLSTVSGITDATAITAWFGGACALISGGTVKCWGNNGADTLGNDSTADYSATPVAVSNLTDAVALSVGPTSQTMCAVRASGAVVCWGNGMNGQLGTGAAAGITSSVPLAVKSLAGVASVAAGSTFTVALLQNGRSYGWGFDANGQIDNPAADTNLNSSPLVVTW